VSCMNEWSQAGTWAGNWVWNLKTEPSRMGW
jgi:hypothetical protein